jgi:hypothetical protein
MHSITLRRMEQFRRRRNGLLIARGFAAGSIMLFVATILCAVVDAWWVFPPHSRWTMAAVVYSLAVVVFAAFVIRPWLKAGSKHWLAEHLEQVEPKLKERLVAAVELEQQTEKLGSPAFREALQRSVARRIEAVEVRKILPWTLIRIWIWLLVGSLLVVGILCSWPSLYMPTRLGRVLLPMVNIGRVSRYAIEIVQPTSDVRFVPEDDILSVQAMVHGRRPEEVQLEIVHFSEAHDAIRQLPMYLASKMQDIESALGDGLTKRDQESRDATDSTNVSPASTSSKHHHLFQAHYTPPLGKSRFRVVAEDAVSAWHDFETVPRPSVKTFEIEYKFPEYSQLPNEKLLSDKGDLQALSGTLAKLSIETNQAKVDGELVIRPKDKSRVSDNGDTRIVMERAGDGRLTADVPIDFSATYRAELVATETSFTNAFSPTYSIVALEDKSPRVRWQTPNQMNVPVKPDELLDMTVFIEDEVPLAELKQRLRIGRGDWQIIERPLPTKAEEAVSFRTDILPLNVQPGDVIQTDMVATDRRGQSTTTDPIELVVSSVTLDPKRQDLLKKRAEIVSMIEAVEEELRVKSVDVEKSRELLQQQPMSDLAKKNVADSIESFSRTLQRETSRIRNRIIEQLPDIKNAVASEEHELMARNLSRLEIESGQKLANLDREMTDQSMEAAERHIAEIVADTANLSKRSRDLVSHDIISQIGQDLQVLYGYQRELKNTMRGLEPEQYRRRQALVARQMQDLAEMLRENLPTLRNRSEKAGKQWLDWLDSQASKIIEATGRPERNRPTKITVAEGQRLADQVLDELRKHQNAGSIDSALDTEQLKARDSLAEKARSPSRVLRPLVDSLSKFAEPELRDTFEKTIVDRDLPAIEQLTAHREMQQSRNDGDNQYVADLGEAYRAAKTIAQDRQIDPQAAAKRIEQLQQSVGKLDALHLAQQALKTLNQVYDIERWEAGSLRAQFEQPRAWEAFQQQLHNATKAMRDAKIDSPAVAQLEESLRRDSLKHMDDKIAARRWSSESLASAAPELDLLRKNLDDSMTALNEIAKTARQDLSALTPSVSQLARDAATQIQQTANQTDQLAQAIEQEQVPDIRPRIQQVDQSMQANEPPMKQLRDGLADLASRQNVMNENNSRVARDADTAIGLTHTARQRMIESFDAVKQAEEGKAAETLSTSAKIQADAAKSMEKLAEHFEQLAKLKDVPSGPRSDETPSPDTIAKISDEMAGNAEMNQAHNDADRLRRLATIDPKRVMAELEKELKRNQPMQAELSEIAREAVHDALETLDFTADEENELNVSIENSDDEFLALKEQLKQEVQRAAQAAEKITHDLAPRVKATAERAFDADAAKLAEQMTSELAKKMERSSAIDSTSSLQHILAAAKDLHSALDVYSGVTTRQSQALSVAAEKSTIVSDAQRQQLQREMRDWQSKYRDEDIKRAFNEERDIMQATRNSQQGTRRAEQSLEQLEKMLKDAKKQLDKNPDQERFQQAVAESEASVQTAHRQLTRKKTEEDLMTARLDSMKKRREEIQLQTSKPFTKPNAAAELGARVAMNAAKTARDAAKALAEAVQNATRGLPAESSLEAMTLATKDQQGLQANVANAADGLARAARHEDRLNQNLQGDMLGQQAEQVAKIAQGSMRQASQRLAGATQAMAAKSTSDSVGSEATSLSQQALQAAENELRQQAEALRSAVSGKANGSDQAKRESRTSNEGSQSALLSPQEMARMLDELDHLLNMPKEGQQPAQSGQQNAKAGESTSNQAKSGASGAPSESPPKDASQTLSEAAERLTAEMNQQRQAMESTAQAVPGTGSSESQSRSSQTSGKSIAGSVPAVEILNIEDWGKLRQQTAEDAREGSREEIPAAYRLQIEEYYRRLSKRRASSP